MDGTLTATASDLLSEPLQMYDMKTRLDLLGNPHLREWYLKFRQNLKNNTIEKGKVFSFYDTIVASE